MPSKRYPRRGKDASQSKRQERVGIDGAFAAVLLSEETGEDEDDPGEASEDEEDAFDGDYVGAVARLDEMTRALAQPGAPTVATTSR